MADLKQKQNRNAKIPPNIFKVMGCFCDMIVYINELNLMNYIYLFCYIFGSIYTNCSSPVRQ